MPRKHKTRPVGNIIRAVIFDLDGVLIDSEPLWMIMAKEYFSLKGIALPPWFPTFANKNMRGIRVEETSAILKKKFGIRDPLAAIHRDRLRIILRLFRTHLKLMPGAVIVIKKLAQKYPLAVVSSSPAIIVSTALKKFRLRKYFRVVLSGESVRKSKPDPQIFLLGAKKLNVPPTACMVVEDSIAGITAANRTGMKTVLLKVPYTTKEQLAKADRVITRLSQLPRFVSQLS